MSSTRHSRVNPCNLHSNSNLIATGVNDEDYEVCAPIAEFHASDLMICEGEEVSFIHNLWNGTPETYSWSFEGGTPSTSVSSDPNVRFLNAGTYDVSLNVSNESGNNTYTRQDFVFVSSREAKYSGWHFEDDFEDETKVN